MDALVNFTIGSLPKHWQLPVVTKLRGTECDYWFTDNVSALRLVCELLFQANLWTFDDVHLVNHHSWRLPRVWLLMIWPIVIPSLSLWKIEQFCLTSISLHLLRMFGVLYWSLIPCFGRDCCDCGLIRCVLPRGSLLRSFSFHLQDCALAALPYHLLGLLHPFNISLLKLLWFIQDNWVWDQIH